MLDHLEAEQIVKDCIRRVRGFGGGVDSSQKLKEVGIQTPDMVKDLRNTIATDQGIGVPSVRDHRIALSTLSMTMNTKVLQVQNMVLFNVKGPDEREALIAKVTFELTAPKAGRANAEAATRPDIRGFVVGEGEADTVESARSNVSTKKASKKGKGK